MGEWGGSVGGGAVGLQRLVHNLVYFWKIFVNSVHSRKQ